MTLFLNHCGIVCALGDQHAVIKRRLLDEASSGVFPTDAWSKERMLPLGSVVTELPNIDHFPLHLRSRNNQLVFAALLQIRPAIDHAIARYGRDRVAIVLGTSTSGIASTEEAILHLQNHGFLSESFHYAQQEMGSPADFLANELGVSGPVYVHSSACSSSAKAMASAARLINMDLCDAVITGGVDTLCAFTVAGFSALDSVSTQLCNPLSVHRNGINIGEGAALFLMTKEAEHPESTVSLCGWGESSDGYHISAPDPQGSGARLAINAALQRAGITAQQIDYINLHGTATIQNDAMESRIVDEIFGNQIPVSSTKPFTGHTLGAAAAIEAGLCWLVMQDDNAQGKLPPHLWDGVADPELPAINVVVKNQQLGRPIRYALSNSFAFGGSNASLIFGKKR